MALEIAGVLVWPPPTMNVGPPAVRAGCDVEQMGGACALDRHRNDGNALHVAEDGRGYGAAFEATAASPRAAPLVTYRMCHPLVSFRIRIRSPDLPGSRTFGKLLAWRAERLVLGRGSSPLSEGCGLVHMPSSRTTGVTVSGAARRTTQRLLLHCFPALTNSSPSAIRPFCWLR